MIIVSVILLALLLCIPVPRRFKDGGTVEYNAVLYSVRKVHSLYYGFGYLEGTQVRVLFSNVFDDVELPKRLFEITEEDLEAIRYVNENSNIGLEFMKPLGDIELDTNPSHDSSYHETSDKGLVDGTGYYVSELGGVYLSKVEINNNDTDSDILGIRNKDRYGDAAEKLEEHGFHFLKTISISSSYEEVIYNKGRVAVVFYLSRNKKMDEKNYPIRSVMVKLYSEKPLSEQKKGTDHVI